MTGFITTNSNEMMTEMSHTLSWDNRTFEVTSIVLPIVMNTEISSECCD